MRPTPHLNIRPTPLRLATNSLPTTAVHHDLPSFLVHAERHSLNPESKVYVGTRYEYQSQKSLSRFGITLQRVGKTGDRGIDLRGRWKLPHSKTARQFEVLAQCKALKNFGGSGPALVRELEGAVSNAAPEFLVGEEKAPVKRKIDYRLRAKERKEAKAQGAFALRRQEKLWKAEREGMLGKEEEAQEEEEEEEEADAEVVVEEPEQAMSPEEMAKEAESMSLEEAVADARFRDDEPERPPLLGVLMSPLCATKGIRQAMGRSRLALVYTMINKQGVIEQFLWNKRAAQLGMEGLRVNFKYNANQGVGATQKKKKKEPVREIVLLWDGKPEIESVWGDPE